MYCSVNKQYIDADHNSEFFSRSSMTDQAPLWRFPWGRGPNGDYMYTNLKPLGNETVELVNKQCATKSESHISFQEGFDGIREVRFVWKWIHVSRKVLTKFTDLQTILQERDAAIIYRSGCGLAIRWRLLRGGKLVGPHHDTKWENYPSFHVCFDSIVEASREFTASQNLNDRPKMATKRLTWPKIRKGIDKK